MLLTIDFHSGLPIYRQIIVQVHEQIMAGLLKEGEQLITVRELAERLSINPMTVSKAYSIMEAQGLIERRRGVGLFVAQNDHSIDKELKKESIIEAILSKAITTAMQFKISREKAEKIFSDCWNKLDRGR